MYVDKRKLRCDNLTHTFHVLKIAGLSLLYVRLSSKGIYLVIKYGRIFL